MYPEVATERASTPRHSRLFEILTRVVAPLILAIVAAMQSDRTKVVVLAAVAGLALILGVTPSLWVHSKRAYLRLSDRALAKRVLRQLKELVRDFGEFLDPHRGDTLESVVTQALQAQGSTDLSRLGLTSQSIFRDMWYYTNARCQDMKVSVTSVALMMDECAALINNYVRHCVEPVFNHLPADHSSAFSARVRADLEAFRERLIHLENKYQDLGRVMASDAVTIGVREPYLVRPRPLVL
jgi:hypothetical protein